MSRGIPSLAFSDRKTLSLRMEARAGSEKQATTRTTYLACKLGKEAPVHGGVMGDGIASLSRMQDDKTISSKSKTWSEPTFMHCG